MGLSNFTVELSLHDAEACNCAAREILAQIRPHWRPEDIKFEIFTVGITNKIFAAGTPTGERIIFRVFGKNTEKVIDRAHELKSWAVLAKEGLAAPLIGLFKNGIVCGYIPGKNLDVNSVRQPEMQKKIASAMARMHSIEISKEPCVFAKMRTFLCNLNPDFGSEYQQKKFESIFEFSNLKNEIDKIEKLTTDLDAKVGFCHNDLLVFNILYDDDSGRLSFIDYEYADSNFIEFDICNHFCEWQGIDNPDFSKVPNLETRRSWLRYYLKCTIGNEPEEAELSKFVKRTDLFMAMSHLFWSIWALVQAQNSLIEFDYLGYFALNWQRTFRYAIDRYRYARLHLNEYKSRM